MRLDAQYFGRGQSAAGDLRELTDVRASVDHRIEVRGSKTGTQFAMPLPNAGEVIKRRSQRLKRVQPPQAGGPELVEGRVQDLRNYDWE